MPINLENAFVQKGPELIGLLRFCVKSVKMGPLFAFLVREYRLQPTHIRALTLYDLFCAPAAPARLRAPDVLPPRDYRLVSAITPLREQWVRAQAPVEEDEEEASRTSGVTVPLRSLFDFVVTAIEKDPKGNVADIRANYDPALTPEQNLPHGRMSASQRTFVDNVWMPNVRPRLVAAGFRRLSSIA